MNPALGVASTHIIRIFYVESTQNAGFVILVFYPAPESVQSSSSGALQLRPE
jgi:hypothetical protein